MGDQDYSTIVQECWDRLLEDFASYPKFDPWEEEDVRCYLYYLILKRVGDTQLVHAQWPYDSRKVRRGKKWKKSTKFIDILVGPSNRFGRKPGLESVPVEIKWTYLADWTKTRHKSWYGDVKKLTKHRTKRQPIFALFVPKPEAEFGPISKEELTGNQLETFEWFRREAKERYDVKVLLPY